MIGKSEILNILSCERVFTAVENWMAKCSRTSGLIFRLRTRIFEAKNCQAVSAGAVFCFLNIFVENERTNAE